MSVTVEPEDIKRVIKQAIHEDTKDRRERIATAALAGTIALCAASPMSRHEIVATTLDLTDRLIAELDK